MNVPIRTLHNTYIHILKIVTGALLLFFSDAFFLSHIYTVCVFFCFHFLFPAIIRIKEITTINSLT